MSHHLLTSFLVYLFFTCQAYSQNVSQNNLPNIPDDLQQFWHSMSTLSARQSAQWITTADRIHQLTGQHLNSSSSSDSINSTRQCWRSIEQTLRNGVSRAWSAQLITSNGFTRQSLIAALVADQFTTLNDFTDCLAVTNSEEVPYFTGKYCLLMLSTPNIGYANSIDEEMLQLAQLNASSYFQVLTRNWLVRVKNRFPLAQSICVPSICSERDVERLVRNYFENDIQGLNLTVDYCQAKPDLQKFKIKPGLIVAIIILSITISLSAAGTLLHLPLLNKYSTTQSMLTLLRHHFAYFDLVRNVKLLLEAKVPSKEDPDLRFIYGLKVQMLFVVCLVHGFIYLTIDFGSKLSTFRHFPSAALELFTSPLVGDFAEKGPMMISTFFIVSGFLNTFTLLNSRQKQLPNFFVHLTRRWLLFLAPVIGTLCLTIIFQHLGTGPLMHYSLTDPYVSPCHNHWLRHLFFLQNLYPITEMCGLNLWFIGALFQLYIIQYFVVLVWFYRKDAAFICATLLAGLTPALLFLAGASHWSGYPLIKSLADFRFRMPWSAITFVYMTPVSHFVSYFAGVLCALILLKSGNTTTISTRTSILCTFLWSAAYPLLLHLPLPSSLRTQDNIQYNLTYNSLVLLIYLALVAVHSAWFLVMLFTTLKSPLKKLLSHPLWQPLSRLSLCIYLVNSLIIWYSFHLTGETPSMSFWNSAKFAFTSYVQSVFLAIGLYLLFEGPFTELTNDLFRGRRENTDERKMKPVIASGDVKNDVTIELIQSTTRIF